MTTRTPAPPDHQLHLVVPILYVAVLRCMGTNKRAACVVACERGVWVRGMAGYTRTMRKVWHMTAFLQRPLWKLIYSLPHASCRSVFLSVHSINQREQGEALCMYLFISALNRCKNCPLTSMSSCSVFHHLAHRPMVQWPGHYFCNSQFVYAAWEGLVKLLKFPVTADFHDVKKWCVEDYTMHIWVKKLCMS